MDRKSAYHIVLGLVIGAVFGMGIGAANGYPVFGIGLGALFGAFIGWFLAAAVENRNKNRSDM